MSNHNPLPSAEIAVLEGSTCDMAKAHEPPLPLLLRDIARGLAISVPEACEALRAAGLGNYSQGMAVTSKMAAALRQRFDSPKTIDITAVAAPPNGYESTTPVYARYVSPARFARFSPAVQKWYRPYWAGGEAPLNSDVHAHRVAVQALQGLANLETLNRYEDSEVREHVVDRAQRALSAIGEDLRVGSPA